MREALLRLNIYCSVRRARYVGWLVGSCVRKGRGEGGGGGRTHMLLALVF